MRTGVLSNIEFNQEIEFPIRICDLTPNTHVGITIYDLYRTIPKGPLASTVINIFDSTQSMRQGTFNLYLWRNRELDMSLQCTTPGLFEQWPDGQELDMDSEDLDPEDDE